MTNKKKPLLFSGLSSLATTVPIIDTLRSSSIICKVDKDEIFTDEVYFFLEKGREILGHNPEFSAQTLVMFDEVGVAAVSSEALNTEGAGRYITYTGEVGVLLIDGIDSSRPTRRKG